MSTLYIANRAFGGLQKIIAILERCSTLVMAQFSGCSFRIVTSLILNYKLIYEYKLF